MEKGYISGNQVILRPLSASYFQEYLQHFSPEIQQALQVSCVDSEYNYLRQCAEKQKNGKTHFYCVFDRGSNQLIGAIEVRDKDAHRGQLYCWLMPDYHGTGCFQEALALAMKDYFLQSSENFVSAHVDVHNIRSYRALKNAGFADLAMRDGPHGKQYVLILRKQMAS